MAKAAKKLVIVESPAKAKTIEKFLGRGYSVRASLGHVRDLPKRRLGVDVDHEFEPSYVVPKEKKGFVKELAQEARNSSEVLLATDPDREGEAIAWHLTQAIGTKARPVMGRRIVFHEITRNAVQEALKHPRAIDGDLVDAQQARRVIDRLVGYKLSPLLWHKVKKGLSAGRVQSVAVRLIVDREREIEAFLPVEYWTVEALLRKEVGAAGGHAAAQRKRDEFTAALLERNGVRLEIKDEATATAAVEGLRRAAYRIADVRRREASRSPAPPFITSTLQQEAGRRLSFTAKRTMTVAQQLYEGLDIPGEGHVGLITYMRTDSTHVAQEALDEVRRLVGERFGAEFVPGEPRVYKTKAKGAQEAHEAIRPSSSVRTPEALRGHITADQYRLYSLIWKRFVGSQMENAVFDTTAVDVMAEAPPVSGQGAQNGQGAENGRSTPATQGEYDAPVHLLERESYLLRATGSVLRFAGFLKVMADADEDEDSRKRLLPELERGEPLELDSVTPEQHFTQPPPRFTEAALIKALEEEGIGRPSTYAPILSTVQDRGYVEKVEKALRPTELGTIVNDLLVEHFPNVVDVGFTAQIEEHLDQVAEGEASWVPVVREFYDPFALTLEKASEMMERVEIADEPSDEVCDLCGKPMVIKLGRFGKFLACSGFPECRNTRTLLNKIGVACPQCGSDLIERKTKTGRTFFGCSTYPTCTFSSWQRPVPERCPVEGGLQTIRARGKVVCTVCGRVGELGEQSESDSGTPDPVDAGDGHTDGVAPEGTDDTLPDAAPSTPFREREPVAV
ncbi:MAG: type I DNA topoisomerase [Chloroflexota bacterium]|nr:type I DNA topoisomerase [Chloroflexota bacterium]